jgi:hypothetical protein
MKGEASRRQIVKLGRHWEQRGWLTEPQRDENGHPIGRQVTPVLEDLAGIAPAHEAPTPSEERGQADKAVQRASESEKAGEKAGHEVLKRPSGDTESEDGLSAVLSPSDPGFCPVTACQWNNDGRGVCDYAQRGLRCGNPQWRDEWREAVVDIEGQ